MCGPHRNLCTPQPDVLGGSKNLGLVEDVEDGIPGVDGASGNRAAGVEGVAVHELRGVFGGGRFGEADDDEGATLTIGEGPGADEFAFVFEGFEELAVLRADLQNLLATRGVVVQDDESVHAHECSRRANR